MNNIQYNRVPSTFSHVVIAGVLAAQMIPSEANAGLQEPRPLLESPYIWNGSKATYDRYSNPITGGYNSAQDSFEAAVGNFYSRLLIGQEPLGADFEKVLNENLWDLYES